MQSEIDAKPKTWINEETGEVKKLHSSALVNINGKLIDLNDPVIQNHIKVLKDFAAMHPDPEKF